MNRTVRQRFEVEGCVAVQKYSEKLEHISWNGIFKRFQNTGEVDPKPATSRESLRKHHRLYVIGLIVATPDLHLSELISKVYEITGITVHVSTIYRLLAEHGFTRKKVQHVASSEEN